MRSTGHAFFHFFFTSSSTSSSLLSSEKKTNKRAALGNYNFLFDRSKKHKKRKDALSDHRGSKENSRGKFKDSKERRREKSRTAKEEVAKMHIDDVHI